MDNVPPTDSGWAIGVYGRILLAQIRGQAQYRASFFADLMGSVLSAVIDLVAVVVLFRVTRVLGGFGLTESLLMSTLAAMGFALSEAAVGGVDRLRFHVRTGQLDAVLVRPLGVLGQLIAMDFSFRRLGRVAMASAALAYAVRRASLEWDWSTALLLVIAPLSAAVLFSSIFVAASSVTFWLVDSHEFVSSMTYGGREFTTYPMTVFGSAVRALFGYGLGLGFAGYYPALALLRQPDPLGLPAWAGWCPPLAAGVAAGVAGVVWRIGVRRYRSAGS